MRPVSLNQPFFLLVLVLLLAPALAGPDMVGRWRASGDYTVVIPRGTGSFNLVFERPGERNVHPVAGPAPFRGCRRWTAGPGPGGPGASE